jgi:hypothetical protein
MSRKYIAASLSLLFWGCIAAACLRLLGGCSAPQHEKALDKMGAAAMDIAGRLKDGAAGQFAGGVQAIDPGIEVTVWQEYGASARYKGLAGQMTFAAHGDLGDRVMPPEIVAMANDSSVSRAALAKAIIEWQSAKKTESGP